MWKGSVRQAAGVPKRAVPVLPLGETIRAGRGGRRPGAGRGLPLQMLLQRLWAGRGRRRPALLRAARAVGPEASTLPARLLVRTTGSCVC